MATLEQLKEYNDFMKWFETNHPVTFKQYHLRIHAPVDKTGVKLNLSNLTIEVAHGLSTIIRDYNLLTRKTG